MPLWLILHKLCSMSNVCVRAQDRYYLGVALLLHKQSASVKRCAGSSPCSASNSMIRLSQQLPMELKFSYFDPEGNMQDISVEELTKGKKVRGCISGAVSQSRADLAY